MGVNPREEACCPPQFRQEMTCVVPVVSRRLDHVQQRGEHTMSSPLSFSLQTKNNTQLYLDFPLLCRVCLTPSSQCTYTWFIAARPSSHHFFSNADSHLECICFLYSVRAFHLWHCTHSVLNCNCSLRSFISFPTL